MDQNALKTPESGKKRNEMADDLFRRNELFSNLKSLI